MKIFHEFKCPSCGVKLRLNGNPDWTEGNIRCPSCQKRVTVKLDEKTKKESADDS